jgi:uncharacterized repeat protein (TIGR03803 family)
MSRNKPPVFLLCLTVIVGFLIAASPVRAANETVVLSFNRNDNLPYNPMGGLVSDSAGNLYGTTVGGGLRSDGAVFELTPGATGEWTGKTIHNFNSLDGDEPEARLTLDSAGNLYGTALNGGVHTQGVVFQLSRGANGVWTEKVLHSFNGTTDGDYPQGPLTVDAAGNVYGTTAFGGTGKNCNNHGCGIVFQLTPNANGTWTETVLHNFQYGRVDGGYPVGGVTLDAAGNLYGTTQLGGSHLGGIAFELSLVNGAWTENILHNFCSLQPNCADGEIPSAPLIFDASGNLYGTTQTGGVVVGTGCGGAPCGTVFELSPSAGGAWTQTVLYNFCSVANCADGALPSAGALVFDATGNLYGTTGAGGTSGTSCNSYGCGTVFELSPGSGGVWSETVLFAFPPNGLQGLGELGGLVLDSAGNLYSTSEGGGRFGAGTVFKVTP